MKKILKEPLVHFLALGALLFAIGLARGGSGTPSANRIALSSGVVERLIEGFRLTWQRRPTEAEFSGLVEEYLREEVLYREALQMGLDRDDQIIRRRMRQKLEFLTADFVESIEPTEEELQGHLDADPDRYRRESRLSFTQVFFRGDDDSDAEERARRALRTLRDNGDVALESLGDPSLLPAQQVDVSERGMATTFGAEFAGEIPSLSVGAWSEPIRSNFGVHLVRLDEWTPGRLSELAEVRGAVYRDLTSARTEEAEEQFVEGLLGQYTVTVDWPEGMEPVDIPGVVR
ncbi:MAG: peptidyl-prolyl cis-trans isomerase [Longimicrobiales bacterium]